MRRYARVMIPPPSSSGELPPGIHHTTWAEVSERFGWNEHRRRLLDGLRRGIEALRLAGCTTVYIDGSFVSTKELPNDFDACWDIDGVEIARLDPVLLIFEHQRAAQQIKYFGEFFPAQTTVDRSGTVFLEYFQFNNLTGRSKGIIALDLRELT